MAEMRFLIALVFLHLGGQTKADQCACATDVLNVRRAAGTSNDIVKVMQPGQCATYTGDSSSADGYTWMHLTVDGQSGWAASQWLSVGHCSGTTAAGTSNDIVKVMQPGQCATYTGVSSSADGYTWMHLTVDGQSGWAASSWLNVGACGGAATNCHGSIDNLHPTGMHSGGVSASQAAVRAHLSTLNAMKTCYEQVANTHCIEASVIGGLASRESNGGDSLTAAGYGDAGHAWGILQCDLTHSGLNCLACGARTCCHIEQLVGDLLIPYIAQVAAKHPSWSVEHKLQGGVAAYNSGVSSVQTWAGLDSGTTGKDYSNDVIARAKYLKTLGWS